jgi:hypothetical protein
MMFYLVSAEDASDKRKIDIPTEIVKKPTISKSGVKRKSRKLAKKPTSAPINKTKKNQISVPIIKHGHRRHQRYARSL